MLNPSTCNVSEHSQDAIRLNYFTKNVQMKNAHRLGFLCNRTVNTFSTALSIKTFVYEPCRNSCQKRHVKTSHPGIHQHKEPDTLIGIPVTLWKVRKLSHSEPNYWSCSPNRYGRSSVDISFEPAPTLRVYQI